MSHFEVGLTDLCSAGAFPSVYIILQEASQGQYTRFSRTESKSLYILITHKDNKNTGLFRDSYDPCYSITLEAG